MDQPDGFAELHRDVMVSLERMTREERDRLLKDAGILGEDGALAEQYMPPEDILVQQRRLAARGRDLWLHFSATSFPGFWYVTRGTDSAQGPLGRGETPEAAVDEALANLHLGGGVRSRVSSSG